jgi:hypothetical protein
LGLLASLFGPENRSFIDGEPELSEANNGISARIDRNATLYRREVKTKLKFLSFYFNDLNGICEIVFIRPKTAALVPTAATIGRPYMPIPNGEGGR